jgi:hypothetical protein
MLKYSQIYFFVNSRGVDTSRKLKKHLERYPITPNESSATDPFNFEATSSHVQPVQR